MCVLNWLSNIWQKLFLNSLTSIRLIFLIDYIFVNLINYTTVIERKKYNPYYVTSNIEIYIFLGWVNRQPPLNSHNFNSVVILAYCVRLAAEGCVRSRLLTSSRRGYYYIIPAPQPTLIYLFTKSEFDFFLSLFVWMEIKGGAIRLVRNTKY